MKQRWELIKNLVESKLETKKSFAMCLNLSRHTQENLEKHFKLTFKAGSYIKFEKKGVNK